MTPFVAFGYRKTRTDKHKIRVTHLQTLIGIFLKMKLRGMSQDAIANRLNELGINTTFEYKISGGHCKLARRRTGTLGSVTVVGYWKTGLSNVLGKGQHRTIYSEAISETRKMTGSG